MCSSCLQTNFADSVAEVSTLHPGKHQPLLAQCLTQYKSINEKEWVCLSCKTEIYDGLVPKLSQINKVGFPERPPELDLNRLEEFFVAPLSAFMTIRSLPVCGLVSAGQKLLIGNVVHVANNVGSTVSSLPRMLDDMDTVAVRIKRKKSYKTVVFAENVRPFRVVKALQYLIKNSDMYKPYNFQVPEKWLNHVESSMHDNRYFVEGKYPPTIEEENKMMEDDIITETQFEEVSSAEMTQGNMDTMLTENVPNIINICDQGESEDGFDASNKILTMAPGEGKIPVFKEPLAEYLVFPTKFCGKTRTSNSDRKRYVHTSDIFKAELKHKDKRVWSDPANIFWKAKHLQIQKFASKVTLALRRVVGSRNQNITAEKLLDKEQREDIRRQDDGYHIYKDIPNTPPYFEKLGKELRAMVRQLGNPTIFISLSSADTSWVPLQQALGLLLDEAVYSENFIKEEMTFEQKCQQVSSHPAACSRYFHHRVQKFFKYIIMGPHSPFGNVIDYAHRTEFQKRGSPHIHGLLWIDNAPKFNISSDKEICEYIDSCISCSLDVIEEEKQFVKLQIHKHSRTCKKVVKRKATCRFGVPWPPMQETQILYPLGTENVDEISVLQEHYKVLINKLKKLPEDVETHESWLTYNGIDEDKYIHIIRSTLKRPKVFLKRRPAENRVNAYMKGLLAVWQGNHDVQFVLDPYQCVTYICDYMMKSQKGMSDLLRVACEEAKAGNMNLRERIRHMGNKFLNAVEEPIQACCYAILQLPISYSTRKKEFINTSPPEERVGLTKSLKKLEQLEPNSKDVTYKSNIDRYMMRPKQLASWCLADYVAKIDIEYPSKEKFLHCDTDEEVINGDELEDHDQHVSYYSEGNFPIQMRNGIMLKQRTKNKVIRFRNYRLKNDSENYYRERLMLYVPWKKERDILGKFNSYEEAFRAKHDLVKQKMEIYEPMSAVLELVDEELELGTHENDPVVAPSTQHENDTQGEADPSTLHELTFHEPDHTSTLHQVDIGPLLGIAPVHTELNDVDLIPHIMTDEKYYKLLGQLNRKQEEFHTHIMHQAAQGSGQVLCALHGGAGTGKSTVTRAIYQGLYRLLNKHSGDDFSVSHALLIAPTGRAAYNIHGCTIHCAFMIAANQKLEHRALSWDNLNILRNRFHKIKWILLDEFSMVGNTMLKLIHLRLQEAKGNLLPFGGVNIICVGDLYQLQPVMQSYIFMDIATEYGPLATNLWKEYFTMFELTEIMRQKDDQEWKGVLSRIRVCDHTSADIELIMTREISREESLKMIDIPHLFPTRDGVAEFNEAVLQRTPGQITFVKAVDSPPSDISTSMQKLILAAAQNKDINSTGNLPYQLAIKEGVLYDLTANIDVEDGMVNGAECRVRYIEKNLMNESFPKCIWVEFIDSIVGKKLRQSWNTQNNSKIPGTWTPVFSIRRSFIVRRNQNVFRAQFPLQVAAARTVHKSQSSTCSELVVDFSTKKSPPKHFWEHLIYVGLSRVPSLKGLHVVNLNAECI